MPNVNRVIMTHTFRSVLLEKFEIIENGKCYSDEDHVSLSSAIYSSEVICPRSLQVFRTPQRLPFAEAVTKPFSNCALGASIGPAWTTAWFKVDFYVPGSYAGRELHFRWASGCEAMVWSSEGLAIQGVSEQGFRFVPVDTSHAPCDITFYVEAAANTLLGNGDGGLIKKPDPNATFALQRCECAEFNRAAYLLLQKFKICAQMAKHLQESDPVSSRALHCATRASCIIQPAIDSTFEPAERALKPALSARGAPARPTIFACGHCHIDCAW
jgi:alpha-mannosidase